MPNLNEGIVKSFSFLLPSISEQQAIVSVLDALDNKIDLNKRTNETLEAIARAIFKDWFIDFGPTRAKMEARVRYLALEVWSMFPDRLDVEGKPEGWTSFRLDQLAVHHTRNEAPGDKPDKTFEHFSLPAFDAGQIPSMDLGLSIKSNKTQVPSDAILLSKLNPEIERVWIPEPAHDIPQVCSTEFLAFTPTSIASRSLLYGLFTEASFRTMLQSMVTGTSKSHQRISPPALLSRDIMFGHAGLFSQYAVAADKLLLRVLSNRAESRSLSAMRDLLLPKLTSGEVRVKDAEKLVERVA